MRRYTISVNDTTKVIDVEVVGANLFRVQLDGRLIDVTLDDHRDLAHSAVTPGITPRAAPAATRPEPSSPGVQAPAAAASRPVATASPAASPAPAGASPAGGGGGGLAKMTAPMPGEILSVDVAVGASVSRGQSLMVLEAMKMKNELKAPRDGVVAEIYVSAGQSVKFGETLVRFEE
ncbi:biotin/lipoyl-containing protein [Nigerium sp.]|uniref:biotin/lipoyl-containing protein n=1 Tax=Nigerium sp. TaxID=2042655 RepID=UPI0032217166